MIPLILARIDVGQIVTLLFIVITVLSWFVNFIQGNTPDGNPRQQKPKPKPPTGQSEIETLLQQFTSNKQSPQPEKKESQQRPQKPPVERPRQRPQPAKQKPVVPMTSATQRQMPRVSNSNLPSANLGAGVRTHQLGNRVEAAVEKEVIVPVQHDLGNRIAAAAPPMERQVHPLVKVLRDSNGVRQAILLNEILQRPKAFRR